MLCFKGEYIAAHQITYKCPRKNTNNDSNGNEKKNVDKYSEVTLFGCSAYG